MEAILQSDCYKEIEDSILACALIAPNVRGTVFTDTREEDYYHPASKELYRVLKRMGDAMDLPLVAAEIQKDKTLKCLNIEDVTCLVMEAPLASNIKFYIEKLLDMSKDRKVKQDVEILNSLVKNPNNEGEILATCLQIQNTILGRDASNVQQIGECANEVLSKLEHIYTNKLPTGIPTGFKELDRMFGGFEPSKVYIIGGRPSMGKSALMMNMAEHIANEGKIVYVRSLEMNTSEYTQRLMLARASLNKDMINQGMLKDQDFEKIFESYSYVSELNIFMDDRTPCTLASLESGILNLIAKQGRCDIVFVDYIQLMSCDDRKSKDIYGDVTILSKGIKQLARKYNIPIVVLSQLSRALEGRADKRPMLSDLRESGSLEQDADVVMFTFREEYYDRENPTLRGQAEIGVRKNRDGRVGVVDMLFDGSRCKFMEKRNV